MHKKIIYTTVLLCCVVGVYLLKGLYVSKGLQRDKSGYQTVHSVQDVYALFPKKSEDIKAQYDYALTHAQKDIELLESLTDQAFSKESVLYAFDKMEQLLNTVISSFYFTHSVHPDADVRATAIEHYQKLATFAIERISSNKKLYHLFKAYKEKQASQDALTDAEWYALQDLIEGFERSGLNLPDQELQKVVELQKQLLQASNEFESAIAQDTRTLLFSQEDLAGLTDDELTLFEKDEQGKYIIKLDYPTQDVIMRNAQISETRKQFYRAMNTKGYPGNKQVLEKIINLRDDLAHTLGFKSYAHLDLDDQMINDPVKARSLQIDILPLAKEKALKEVALIKEKLPEDLITFENGKMQPWDSGFAGNYVKKHSYNVDESEIAEYFPMQKTIDGLFAIYQQFFGLEFKTVTNPQAWHEDVQLLQVSKKDGHLLGYIFLDMFPRDNKYNHAAKFGILPARATVDSLITPGVCAVVCNFTKPTDEKPSLLKYNEVNTFFHEFGHALHHLLGATRLALHAGTQVKRDFVETPSQMLENWMEDKEIVRSFSSHYQTGEKIPEALINKKIELIKLFTGMHETRQLSLGLFALSLFEAGKDKDIEFLFEKYAIMASDYILFDKENKMYASFGHLTGYGAKYYGYLWARILGADIFGVIEKEGLLNEQAGKRYSEAILEPGGSRDPYQMVTEYLGREPNPDTYLIKSGFKKGN